VISDAPMLAPLVAILLSAAHPQGGEDFTAEAKLLFKLVACQGDAALPANLDAKIHEAHCKELEKKTSKYRDTWIQVAEPFIQKLKPGGLPTTVVYPFGGGDLLSALTTYPEAVDITTMSLEHAGDPRRVNHLDNKQLEASLKLIRQTANGLLTANDSKTENLMKGQRGELPGQLSFFLIALAVHGYEPVSLRYVRAGKGGAVEGQTAEDIQKAEGTNAQLLRKVWVSPDFSAAFSNSELTFVKKGGDPKKDARVHRHFAANLDDNGFGTDADMQAYLKGKGKIVAMTKAASYLLWRDAFSKIRSYLLENMEFMVSDSTGVPPELATKAGFEQQAFGRFQESFLNANPTYNDEFRKLFANAPELPFRYGYLDKKLQKHLVVTRKAGSAPAAAPAGAKEPAKEPAKDAGPAPAKK
jgi:hypothetical protein